MLHRRPVVPASLASLAFLVASSAGADPSSLALYGQGTAGSGGLVPRVWAEGTLHPGSAGFRVTLDRALGGSVALLFIGTQETAVVAGGVTLLTTPLLMTPPLPVGGVSGVPGDGALTLPLPIPASASLLGLAFRFQWVVGDPGGPAGLAATSGLRALGTQPPRVLALGGAGLYEVDPVGGALTDLTANFNPGGVSDLALTPDGTIAVVAHQVSTSNRRFSILDMQHGGVEVAFVSVPHLPNGVVITPDGKRAYGITAGAFGTGAGGIVEIDVDPASATFGTQIGAVTNYPANADTLENHGISDDGRVLTVAVFGLGDTPAVIVVDTDPQSPTYNRVTRHIVMSTLPLGTAPLVADVEPNADGSIAYALLLYLGNVDGEVALLDTQTGQLLGVATGVGWFPIDLEVDRRNEYVVVAGSNSGEVTRVGVDPAGPGYLVTTTTGDLGTGRVWQLAIAPDSSRVYVTGADTPSVLELDPDTLAVTQTFPLPSLGHGGLAAR